MIHGDFKLRERKPRKNKEFNNLITQMKKTNHQILSRGFPKFIAIEPEEGKLIWIWKRSRMVIYRGDPLKGLTRYQRFLYQYMKIMGYDCRIL